MSTELSPVQVNTVLPKAVTKPKTMEEKPRLNRSSSIDTIKRINTYICSPQSYLLPAIFTTWMKSGQNGLQSSTEKTIFMFRSLIFGSILFKFLLKGAKSDELNGPLDLQTVLNHLSALIRQQLRNALIISITFKVSAIFLFTELSWCIFNLSRSNVPVGLAFLIVCLAIVIGLGFTINRSYLMKRDVKRKAE